jgi:hypothetical protein
MTRDAGEAVSPVGRRDSGQSWDIPPGIPAPERRSSFQAGVERAPRFIGLKRGKIEDQERT